LFFLFAEIEEGGNMNQYATQMETAKKGILTKEMKAAAINGASFLCYVTPAEHLRLPDVNDVKEGIIAAKIAAHAADIAKGIKGAKEWDYQMSQARRNLDWESMFELAIDSEKARTYRESAKPEKEDTCSMCGNFCAVKNVNRILNGEIVTIYDE